MAGLLVKRRRFPGERGRRYGIYISRAVVLHKVPAAT